MELALSETLQTAAVMVAAFVLLTVLALLLKAESATWDSSENGPGQ